MNEVHNLILDEFGEAIEAFGKDREQIANHMLNYVNTLWENSQITTYECSAWETVLVNFGMKGD